MAQGRFEARVAAVAVVAAGVLGSCSTGSDDPGAAGAAATGGAAGTPGAGGGGGSSAASGAGGAAAGAGGADLNGLYPPVMGTRIAFFGDQSLDANSQALLELIKSEGADLVLHLGDFDYEDNPAAWKDLMGQLGDIPWLAVVGNHDVDQWDGYRAVIDEKLAKIPEVVCSGEPGVKHSCVFNGVRIVLSGIGLLGFDHPKFVADELGAAPQLWRLCGWHLNQNDMQLGTKPDETGWEAHRACQAEGAMIVNGHEHSYGRTLALTDVGNVGKAHGASGDWDLIELAVGRTFVTVSGAGGNSLRAYDEGLHDDDTWWSSGYTNDMTMDDGVRTPKLNLLDPAGAVFMEIGVDGNPARARAYFKTIGGKTIDQFEVTVDGAGLGAG